MSAKTGKTNAKPALAASTSTEAKLEWMDIDLGALKKVPSYGAYKKAQELAKDKRIEFENDFVSQARKAGALEDGMTLRFGYNFGKVSTAKVPDDGRERGVAKERKTFTF